MVLAILRKEILGGGRHGRYYVVRGGYLLLLACVTVPALIWQVDRMRTAATFAATRMGQEFTIPFGILQFVLVVLLAPALSMNALSTERASGGLELLHVAGVGPVSLITGKFASRILWLLLFIVSGLPLFMSGTIMGGVGLETAGLLVAHSVVAAAMGTGLGFSLSGSFRQTVPAMVLAYLGLGAIYLGPPLALVFYDEAFSGTRVPESMYAWSSPIAAIVLSTAGQISRAVSWGSLLPQAALAFFLTVPSLFLVRPRETVRSMVLPRTRDAGHSRAPDGPMPAPAQWRPKIHGNPIGWRDGRAARRALSARILRIAYLLLGALLTAGILLAIAARGRRDHELIGIAVFLLVGGAAVIGLIVGSGAIAEERERRSMPLLRLSRLSALDVLLGKLWGLMMYLWPLLLLPVGVAVLFRFDVAWIPILVAVTTVVMLFASSAVGLGFSSFARRPATAVGLSVTATLVYIAVPPLIIKFADLRAVEDLLFVFNPLASLVGIVDQVSRRDTGYFRDEFWLSLVGLAFMALAGVSALWVALVSLYRREEDAQ